MSPVHADTAARRGAYARGLRRVVLCGVALWPAARSVSQEFLCSPSDLPLELISAPEAVSASGFGQGWTLEQLEQMALAHNSAIGLQAARVQALQGNWVQVGLPPNPTAGYLASDVGEAGFAGKHGAYVGQQLITGGKLGLNRQVAARQIQSAEQEFEAVRQRVLTDVRRAFFRVLVSQEQLRLADRLVELSDASVQTSQDLLAAQEISRVPLLQAKIEAGQARIDAAAARNGFDQNWRHLSSVVGRPDLVAMTLAGSLQETSAGLTWEDSLGRLQSSSPELAAAGAEVERARWAVQRARAQVCPDVGVQVSVQYDDETNSTVAGMQLGMQLPIVNRNQGGIYQAEARLIVAQRDFERLQLELQNRLATEFRNYANARMRAARYADELLPTAAQTLELVRGAYAQSEVSYLELLTAQRTYFRTSLAHLAALEQLWQSRLRIEGLLLDDSLAAR